MVASIIIFAIAAAFACDSVFAFDSVDVVQVKVQPETPSQELVEAAYNAAALRVGSGADPTAMARKAAHVAADAVKEINVVIDETPPDGAVNEEVSAGKEAIARLMGNANDRGRAGSYGTVLDTFRSIPRKMFTISRDCTAAPFVEDWESQGWTVYCYDGDLINELQELHPEHADLFPKLLPIQRSDLLRYAALYQQGGGYADDDVQPYPQAMDNFEKHEHSLMVVGYERFEPQKRKCGDMLCESLAQWQFFSRRQNPMLDRVLNTALGHFQELDMQGNEGVDDFSSIRAQVINVTGPSMFTREILPNAQESQSAHTIDPSSQYSSKSSRGGMSGAIDGVLRHLAPILTNVTHGVRQHAKTRAVLLGDQTVQKTALQKVQIGTLMQQWMHAEVQKCATSDSMVSASSGSGGRACEVLGIEAFGCGQLHSESPSCRRDDDRIWSKHHFQHSWLGGSPVAGYRTQYD